MRMLCGLGKPTSGKGTVAGFDIARQSEAVKKNIGCMSRKFSLYEDLRVWENIRLFAGIYGMKTPDIARKTDEMLASLGFTTEKETMVREKEHGTMEVLLASLVKPIYIILSKVTPYFALAIADLCVFLNLNTI